MDDQQQRLPYIVMWFVSNNFVSHSLVVLLFEQLRLGSLFPSKKTADPVAELIQSMNYQHALPFELPFGQIVMTS
jgi:hypothetical protein